MNTTAHTTSPATRVSPVVVRLNDTLLDSYALLLATQVYHWNVEGPQFYSLHAAFEQQYRDLFEAVDALAERIRALGAYAPASPAAYLQRQAIALEPSPIAAERMIEHLIAGHEAVAQSLQGLLQAADSAGEAATADVATGRLAKHQATLWMLRSLRR